MEKFKREYHDKLTMVSSNPPVWKVSNFLTKEECRSLIVDASPLLQRSMTTDGETQDRTSSTCHLESTNFMTDKVLNLMNGVKQSQLELPQVAKYGKTQEYRPHFDSVLDTDNNAKEFLKNGGARKATVLTYLNNVQKGGETEFPLLKLKIRPQEGDAVVFFPTLSDGTVDKMTLHAGLPPEESDKWVSQVWIRHRDHIKGEPSKTTFYRSLKNVVRLQNVKYE